MFGSTSKDRWGHILILVGVVAWVPYGILKYVAGQEVVIYPFLAVHLTGIIPGFLLRRGDLLRRLVLRQRKPLQEGEESSPH